MYIFTFFIIILFLNSSCFKSALSYTDYLYQLLSYTNCLNVIVRLTESFYIYNLLPFSLTLHFLITTQLRMRHCSLTNIPFCPFTYRGPIVLVLIKQFLAPMNRDDRIYTGTCVHTPTSRSRIRTHVGSFASQLYGEFASNCN